MRRPAFAGPTLGQGPAGHVRCPAAEQDPGAYYRGGDRRSQNRDLCGVGQRRIGEGESCDEEGDREADPTERGRASEVGDRVSEGTTASRREDRPWTRPACGVPEPGSLVGRRADRWPRRATRRPAVGIAMPTLWGSPGDVPDHPDRPVPGLSWSYFLGAGMAQSPCEVRATSDSRAVHVDRLRTWRVRLRVAVR